MTLIKYFWNWHINPKPINEGVCTAGESLFCIVGLCNIEFTVFLMLIYVHLSSLPDKFQNWNKVPAFWKFYRRSTTMLCCWDYIIGCCHIVPHILLELLTVFCWLFAFFCSLRKSFDTLPSTEADRIFLIFYASVVLSPLAESFSRHFFAQNQVKPSCSFWTSENW